MMFRENIKQWVRGGGWAGVTNRYYVTCYYSYYVYYILLLLITILLEVEAKTTLLAIKDLTLTLLHWAALPPV
jgi:hypothetical protein